MTTKHTFLAHTADVRLKATGETLPELFNVCLKGMNELLKQGLCDDTPPVDVRVEINLSGDESTVLLIDFLSEVLTMSNLHKAIFCRCSMDQMSDHELVGTIYGTQVESFDTDIKAVTYHEANIELNEEGDFETIVVFDI